MPIVMSKKKLKRSQKNEPKEPSFQDSVIWKSLSRVPAAIFLLFLIFLWSSSSTFISGSIVHVCVTSRKLSNLYCLSAGTQPAQFQVPLPLINTTSRISNMERNSKGNFNITGKSQGPVLDNPRNSYSIIKTSTRNERDGTREERGNVIQEASGPAIKSPLYGGPMIKSSMDEVTVNVTQEAPISIDNSSSNGAPVTKTLVETVNFTLEALISPTKSPPYIAPVIRNATDKVKVNETSEVPTSVSMRPPGTQGATMYAIRHPSYGTPTVGGSMDDKAREEEIRVAKRKVEEIMQVLRSYTFKKNHSGCEGRGIYVYDLPPKFNKDLISQCSDMMTWMDFCKFFTNDAFGEPVAELGPGWYNTHQYSLEPIFHSRVLKHPCRVHDVDEAKIFYVPFYGGLDVLRWHFKQNVSTEVKDKLSSELIEWLQLQKPWTRKFGLDHVFVLGKISWDFRRLEQQSWGTKLLVFDEMQNPMKLLIERQPWHINDVAIPHPTFFHPQSDDDVVTWQRKIMQTERRSLVSFAGAGRAKESIRSVLIEQCTSAEECRFLNCKEMDCSKPSPIVKLFMESEFCLQPVGDSPTRKSVFDSLISGCIPVLFSPFTAYYQYPWHLPEDFRKYSVFIDEEEVRRRKVNVVERLTGIPSKEREEMRRYIVYELMPGLVYADPNSKLERFRDAFSIAMNNLLDRVSTLP
ncbi:hypothetical protein Ancab_014779 [Ancistrocladus abbreviatus]